MRKKYIFARQNLMTMHSRMTLLAGLSSLLILTAACRRETRDEKFRRDFIQFTEKECPKDLDPYTRQDSVVYDTGSRTLTYYYTVRGELDDGSIYTGEITESVRNAELANLKSSIQMKPYKDEGINIRHIYRSITSAETLMELTFTPDDYGN